MRAAKRQRGNETSGGEKRAHSARSPKAAAPALALAGPSARKTRLEKRQRGSLHPDTDAADLGPAAANALKAVPATDLASARPSKRQRVSRKATDAAAASTTHIAVVGAVSSPLHGMLHLDALESIFCCLTFDELRSCSLVSRRWLEAVYSMRGIEEGKKLSFCPSDLLEQVLSSRLARHVNDISIASIRATSAQLTHLFSCMPYLRRLTLALDAEGEWGNVAFPPALTSVSLGARTSTLGFHAFLSALSQHQPLAELDIFAISSPMPAAASLATLQRLEGLRSLVILVQCVTDVLSDEQLRALRVLTQLKHLSLIHI